MIVATKLFGVIFIYLWYCYKVYNPLLGEFIYLDDSIHVTFNMSKCSSKE